MTSYRTPIVPLAGVLLVLGCSAGGPAETTVTTQQPAPGGGSSGTSNPAAPTPTSGQVGTSGPTFDDSELEPTDDCDGVLPVVYRDFNETHPDFEMDFSGDVVRRQLVGATLGADRKPTFLSSTGCPAQQGTPTACADWKTDKPVITSAQTFDQWYRDVAGVNMPITSELTLNETAPGSGTYTYNSNDFFPIPSDQGFGPTPANNNPNKRNYLFTTEIHLSFTYVAKQKFSFRGDDDMWIFINGRLALDLGSMHGSEPGTIDFDAQATALDIVPGRAYSMDIFHAERHTSGSNFGVETNIACFTPAIVR